MVTGLAGQAVGIPRPDRHPERGRLSGRHSLDRHHQAGDSLLFVVDILSSSFDEATGTPSTRSMALTVTMTDDGPTIAFIVDGDKAPSKLVSQNLIKGPGVKVKEDSTVTVKYRQELRRPRPRGRTSQTG